MKNRNTILIAILSAVVCFALLPIAQAAPAPETPDPGAVGGSFNTADGTNALANSSGTANSAFGWFAQVGNTAASFNTAVGAGSLLFNDVGSNTAVGAAALLFNTGSANMALGVSAGLNNDTGDNNIYIGDTGASGESNVIAIANVPATGTSYDACFIGDTSTAIIMPGIVPGVLTAFQDVGVDAGGVLGTFTSSARFKEDIKPMDKASEAIFALKPVTFRYKKEFDATGAPQFGLIAEEVAKVNPSLVAPDRDGKPVSVNYRPVTAMLLNEFLKEHKKVEQLKSDFQATVAQQQKEIQALTAQLKEQAAQIQKVSTQLEVSKPAPQTVANK
jgi:Chaperone of endosialidase